MKDTVTKIEIVKVLELNQDGNDIELIKEIELEKIDSLLLELSKIEFKFKYGPPISVNGICIKIYFNDETYEITGFSGKTIYNMDDKALVWSHRYCSEEKFDSLISKFLNF